MQDAKPPRLQLERAGVRHRARPYDLRYSFASLLLHGGRSVIYVARQLGHGAALTMTTYGHVIDEFEDAPRLSAEHQSPPPGASSYVRRTVG